MKQIKLLTFGLLIFMLAGCITIPTGSLVGELNKTYEGQRVVIYRPIDEGGMYFSALLDGKTLNDSVTRGSVIVEKVAVGAHQFTIELPPLQPGSRLAANTVKFNINLGEQKFIRIRLANARLTTFTGGLAGGSGFGNWNFVLEEVDEATGLREIKALKFAS